MIQRYVLAHWRGEQNLIWCFLINGLFGYLIALLVVVGIGGALGGGSLNTPIGMLLTFMFAVWLIWALVGNFRAAFKAITSPDGTVSMRVLGAVVIVGLLLVVFLAAGDLAHLFAA